MQKQQKHTTQLSMAKTMLPAAAYELFSALLQTVTVTARPPAYARSSPTVRRCAPPAARLAGAGTTLVVDVDGALLLQRRRSLLFAYFMLVALEAGSFLRGLVLLLLYPVIACLGALAGRDAAVRAMAAVAFCGLRVATFRAGRAVLPRWLLEDVAAEALQVTRRAGDPARVVWASAMPRVMVEPFLREYLQVPPAAVVAAREMKTVWGLYTGLMENECDVGEAMPVLRKNDCGGGGDVVGFSAGDSMEFLCSPLASICKVRLFVLEMF